MHPGKTHLTRLGCGFMAGGSVFFGLCHGEHDIKMVLLGEITGWAWKVKVRSVLDLRQVNTFTR